MYQLSGLYLLVRSRLMAVELFLFLSVCTTGAAAMADHTLSH